MIHEFEGLHLSVLVGVGAFQDGEEMLRLGDHAIAVGRLMKNIVAPTFRACPERGEGSARAELKFGATKRHQPNRAPARQVDLGIPDVDSVPRAGLAGD